MTFSRYRRRDRGVQSPTARGICSHSRNVSAPLLVRMWWIFRCGALAIIWAIPSRPECRVRYMNASKPGSSRSGQLSGRSGRIILSLCTRLFRTRAKRKDNGRSSQITVSARAAHPARVFENPPSEIHRSWVWIFCAGAVWSGWLRSPRSGML